MTIKDAIEYEVRSSWWAKYLNRPFLQKMAGIYFANKVGRKFNRYLESIKTKESITVYYGNTEVQESNASSKKRGL